MKVAFRPGQEPNKTALQSSNLARRGKKKRGKPLPHAATKTKTVPKTTKHQKRKKSRGKNEVKSAHGRSTNSGSALVVLFQLTRKRCERARLKQQQETGSKNRQQTGFTWLYGHIVWA